MKFNNDVINNQSQFFHVIEKFKATFNSKQFKLMVKDGNMFTGIKKENKKNAPEQDKTDTDTITLPLQDSDLKIMCDFQVIPYEKIVNESMLLKRFVFFVSKNEKERFTVELTKRELEDGIWMKDCPLFLKFNVNKRDISRNLIDYFDEAFKCDYIKTVMEVDFTGFGRYHDKWFYVYTGGCLGLENEDILIRTTVDGFEFEIEHGGAILNEKDVYIETLDMLNILDIETTLPLLSFTLTSLLTTPLSSLGSSQLATDFVMWLYGSSGYGKTTLASLLTNIFKQKNMLGIDTGVKDQKDAVKLFKDCCFLLDDTSRQKTSNKKNQEIEKVEKFLRAMADRINSLSGYTNGGGMVLFTGQNYLGADADEDKFDFTSSRYRCYNVRMHNLINADDIETFNKKNLEKLTIKQSKPYLKASMFYYTKYLVNYINSGGLKEYEISFDKHKSEVSPTNSRSSNAHSHLITNFETFLKYGREREFISKENYVEYYNEAKRELLKCTANQNNVITDDSVTLFIKTLINLIKENQVLIDITEMLDKTKPEGVNSSQNNLGILSLNKNTLTLKWFELYQFMEEYVYKKAGRLKDRLPGIKVMGKKLRECFMISSNNNPGRVYTTTSKWTKFDNVKELNRCLILKTDEISDVVEAIKIQNNYELKEKKLEAIEEHYTRYFQDRYNQETNQDDDDFNNSEEGLRKTNVLPSLTEILDGDISYLENDNIKYPKVNKNSWKKRPLHIKINMPEDN